ncbi:hypothetical protein OF83DRAFT_1174528 [Amylostereum chailletii]|nr:hypothetical protein OF83DRAFT_1174528 [Amylostereum chailletii]
MSTNNADIDYFQVENRLFPVSHTLLERHLPSSWAVLTQGRLRHRTASSPQYPTFLPNVTALEFGALVKVIHGFWRADEDERAEFYMEWEEWQALLALAFRWRIARVHEIAVLHLYDDFPPEEAEALLVQGSTCGVPTERMVGPACELALSGCETLASGTPAIRTLYYSVRVTYLDYLAQRQRSRGSVSDQDKRVLAMQAAKAVFGLN